MSLIDRNVVEAFEIIKLKNYKKRLIKTGILPKLSLAFNIINMGMKYLILLKNFIVIFRFFVKIQTIKKKV